MISLIYVISMLIVSGLTLDVALYDVNQTEKMFKEYLIKHGKSYPHPWVKSMRRRIFTQNLIKINKQNVRSDNAVFGVNHYSDLTPEELNSHKCLRSFHDIDFNCTIITDITTHDAPPSKDWVKLGAVTSVKDQDEPNYCASCYAFSTIGNIEGQYFIKNNKLIEFSVQEIVDCSTSNNGCEGGYMSNAINDLKKLGGVELNSTYLYVGQQQTCQFDPSKAVVQLKGCTMYNLTNEDALKEVVAKRGPVSIVVSAKGLEYYRSGILKRKDCPGGRLSHAMLLVGYGTDQGVDYWVVKNTMGPEWGENGYVRFARGENTCGFFNEYITSANLL